MLGSRSRQTESNSPSEVQLYVVWEASLGTERELRLGTLTPGQEEPVATRHHGRRLWRGSFPTMRLTHDQHYI